MQESKTDFLVTLQQIGFIKKGAIGNQTHGQCPFCGELKFYANIKTHKWDCKKCSRSGGFYELLNNLISAYKTSDHKRLKELANNRGVSQSSLVRNNIVYSPMNGKFFIPNYFFDNDKKVFNLCSYDGKKVISTHGCKLGLFGWERLVKEKKTINTVWLCEGVWDWIAMDEILHTLKDKQSVAIGCPGAGTFKAEWEQFFEGKNVNILYDKDDPGKLGAIKVHNQLIRTAKDIRHIHWPSNYKEGYDLRDFYNGRNGNASRTLRGVKLFLKSLPPEVMRKDGKPANITIKDTLEFKGKGIDHTKIYSIFKKWLHVPNTDVIDILFGTVIANRMDGDPVWLFLVAPSGGTKTEFLMSVSEAIGIEAISSLTPHTLVSGMTLEGGIDPSLLPKLDGKVLIIKDFTAILNMNKTHRDEIFGIFRDAYDGEFSKPFGNAQWKRYKSKFGIIAGVTFAIERFLSESIAMGERFLRYNIPIDNSVKGRKGYIRRALTNTASETAMRTELKEISNKALAFNFKKIPNIPDNIGEKIISLSQWVCMMRGVVDRDKYSKEVLHTPYTEVGTRIAKQLCKLCYGVSMFKHKTSVGIDEYNIVKAVARSSIISKYEIVFRHLYKNGGEMTTKQIGESCGLPDITVEKVLQDLNLTKVLHKRKVSAFASQWLISNDVAELITENSIYE